MRREREPGESPGLSRSGMQERPPSQSTGLGRTKTGKRRPLGTLPGSSAAHAGRIVGRAEHHPVRACESEDLPAVPDAPRPAAHRLEDGRLAVTVAVP
jgi:hypothetical protein